MLQKIKEQLTCANYGLLKKIGLSIILKPTTIFFVFLWLELLLPSQVFLFLGYCNLPITSSPISASFHSNSSPENAYACYSFPQSLQKRERNLVCCSLFALCNFISSLNMSLLFYVRPLPNEITFGCRSHPSLSRGVVRE